VGAVCARAVTESTEAASSARVIEGFAILSRVLVQYFDGAARRFVIVSRPGLLSCRYFI
jgi:hypothetical protein